ncbi:hypothetical protein [Nafulsella turpanensis]|uniref:hypothetical protein n=1 Tax=Nafulsella turpanensis TaxID=1265690 RepID=UPI00034C8DF0|nr:hypothetical protein [Nafulsella turpanensis]
MVIKQFYDEGLAHASYALLAGKEIAIVDPARDPSCKGISCTWGRFLMWEEYQQ